MRQWAAQAIEHWKEYQPKRYKALKMSGKLQQEAEAAASLTEKALQEEMDQGAMYHEAWEMVRELYLFPPEEHSTNQEPLPTDKAYSLLQEILNEGTSLENQDEENPEAEVAKDKTEEEHLLQGYGAHNKVFTQEMADKARAILKAKLSQVDVGLDQSLVRPSTRSITSAPKREANRNE